MFAVIELNCLSLLNLQSQPSDNTKAGVSSTQTCKPESPAHRLPVFEFQNVATATNDGVSATQAHPSGALRATMQ